MSGHWRDEYAKDQVWLADWRSFKLPYCSLYIVAPDNQWPCKVGISTYAYRRLISLQTAVWKPLKVAACYWTKSVADARRLEKAVHSRLTGDSVWLHGEWFDMRPKDAKEMVEFVSIVEGIELYSEIDNQEVISEIASMVRQTLTNKVAVAIADQGYSTKTGGDLLASLAKSYTEDDMVVPPDLAKQVMLYEEHLEDQRLPSLKNTTG